MRQKRLQSLPVRTSTSQTQLWSSSGAVTPLNARPGELHHSYIETSPYLAPTAPRPPQDAEMDMMDAPGEPPGPHRNSTHLAPEGGHSTGTNRMPTPIQPSFAAQVRGQQREWTANGLHPSTANDQAVPRIMATEADWHTVQNNRRLPSPISEYEHSMSASLQPPPHDMEHPNAMMDVEPRAASQPPESDTDSPGPSPERRGHMRSKHTINNWTWQPGMKKSFSIGYRADCEKCRLKVPGHFNHIVIS